MFRVSFACAPGVGFPLPIFSIWFRGGCFLLHWLAFRGGRAQSRELLFNSGAGAELPRDRLHCRFEGRKFAGSSSRCGCVLTG